MKKLYRSNNDRLLAGVIGGLGEYFDIDPVLLRVFLDLYSRLYRSYPGNRRLHSCGPSHAAHKLLAGDSADRYAHASARRKEKPHIESISKSALTGMRLETALRAARPSFTIPSRMPVLFPGFEMGSSLEHEKAKPSPPEAERVFA